jgi:hypothetical protein
VTTIGVLRTSLSAVAAALRACADTVDELVRAVEEPQPGLQRHADAWPDFMSTTLAARYCGYKTTGGLRKARLDGKIRPSGKRGGAGSWTWARADLDAFLRGHGPTAAPSVETSTSAPASASARTAEPARSPVERGRRGPTRRRPTPETEAALRRIDEMMRQARKRPPE